MPKPLTVTALLLVALAVAVSIPRAGSESECIAVDDFSRAKVGEFPVGWKPRKDEGKSVYSVQEEGGRRFLRAVAKGLGIQAAKEHEWDPAEYPVLAWSWRPRQFADGSDERTAKTNDSALAVYVVWPHSSVTVRSLKYVWSAVAPVGTRVDSSKGLTKVRVVRSGKEADGKWVDERVNIVEDYRRAFGGSEVPKAAGIAVLTDADDTKSSASGDYADFKLCRR
jgi:hypothetical protein